MSSPLITVPLSFLVPRPVRIWKEKEKEEKEKEKEEKKKKKEEKKKKKKEKKEMEEKKKNSLICEYSSWGLGHESAYKST